MGSISLATTKFTSGAVKNLAMTPPLLIQPQKINCYDCWMALKWSLCPWCVFFRYYILKLRTHSRSVACMWAASATQLGSSNHDHVTSSLRHQIDPDLPLFLHVTLKRWNRAGHKEAEKPPAVSGLLRTGCI